MRYCNKATAKSIADSVIGDIYCLEQKYSRYNPKSFLSEINRYTEAGNFIEVDHETASLLNYAATCFKTAKAVLLVCPAWAKTCYLKGDNRKK